MPVALITGASRGLGLALARALAARGWSLVLDARGREALEAAAAGLPAAVAVAGDVADGTHRARLVAATERFGRLDLLVNNASALGPSPLPPLREHPPADLARLWAVNVVAPIALVQASLPLLSRSRGAVIDVTSDAAVEAYPGWGGYGATKAALEHAGRVLALEQPELPVWTVDPGDMRTRMHQDAFPGLDISDLPDPETVVPAFLWLIDARPPSGRYRGADLLAGATTRGGQ